ncbi:hypothetical protein [Hymenobacter sediminicola]|uniref:Uncharacterized protein n=1 Tax=Hymenobacter sediminicola TaxID=2761579 RepID=A0A7G7W7L6_9BACT|nr:hypothetical protein [Hymenobacter sediminicola]QNH62359.1 hypothetical protein H4317_00580 [Hymenobacter sediminicola]
MSDIPASAPAGAPALPHPHLPHTALSPARRRKRAWVKERAFLVQNIVRGNLIHNTGGALHVMRLLTLHKMPAGLLEPSHPWVSGQMPDGQGAVWPCNVVFRTEVATEWAEAGYAPESDEVLVSKVGKFLATMVGKSVPTPEIPHGTRRRMPHAINYLHGAVHYNGLTVLFNNFAEALEYLADTRFRKELRRMIKTERREVTLVFRERNYDPVEYAYFSAFVMSHLPWFANVNGAQRRVMWGNPSPYPAVNIINGNWVADTERLRHGDTTSIVRSPVGPGLYFQGQYGVATRGVNKLEKTHAFLINNWVRRRGFRGGLYFVDRRKVEAEKFQQYKATGGQNFIGNELIQNPLRRQKK